MIQDIREQLKLSREDVAFYLGISTHMVKSIELGRRQIPFGSLEAVLTLKKAILKGQADGPVTDVAPATAQQVRLMKRLHRNYSRRLNKYTHQLGKMREAYAGACSSLAIYQPFAASLALAHTADERARLKWVKWKIEEVTYHLKENNPTAQEILSLEIASLQSRIARLNEWI